MTVLDSPAAYGLWAETYDSSPNPILALEERILRERLEIGTEDRVLDLATGTGRWLAYALSRGADAAGIDLSAAMLAKALRKGLRGRLAQANLSALPFPDNFADLAICSFALSYLASPDVALREMARTSRCVVVSDLHSDAVHAGWARSFRVGERKYEIASHTHSIAAIHSAAGSAGLKLSWQMEPQFGEQEREIFQRAGKGMAFDAMKTIPALLICCWTR